jgi:hypothetical protein
MQPGGKAYADSVDLTFEEVVVILVTANSWGQISQAV